MKKDKMELLFAGLADDYRRVQETKKFRKKHQLRSYVLMPLVVCLSLISAYFAETLWLSIPSALIWLVSLTAFVLEFPKIQKYQVSSNEEIFFSLCRAYETIQISRRQHSDAHLKEATKLLAKAVNKIRVTIYPSFWKTVREFNDQIKNLCQTTEDRIISNLSTNAPDERLEAIAFETLKLAEMTRDTSSTDIQKYIRNLKENNLIPEPVIRLDLKKYKSTKIINFMKRNSVELGKAIGLFAVSLSFAISFHWLLCQLLTADISDLVGSIVTATFLVWAGLLRIVGKKR